MNCGRNKVKYSSWNPKAGTRPEHEGAAEKENMIHHTQRSGEKINWGVVNTRRKKK